MPKSPVATLPRFLAPDLDPSRPTVRLPADEARHLARVLRLGPGAAVRVFDGRGTEFAATVASTHGDVAELQLVEAIAAAIESPVPLTLVQAVLKGEAMDAVIRDATMMGVASIRPVLTSHVVVKPSLALRPEQAARWRRVAVASAKQCRRATVPEIVPPAPLADALAVRPPRQFLCVEPSAPARPVPLPAALAGVRPSAAALLVGPEGGWAVEEIAACLDAGAEAVTLGGLTLRADAVALAALAVIRCLWDDATGVREG
jgi:16S rRNA (uracil1498-N3)-methyltransferase